MGSGLEERDRFEKLGRGWPAHDHMLVSIPNPALSDTGPAIGPFKISTRSGDVWRENAGIRCGNAFVGVGCRRNGSSGSRRDAI